MSPNLCICKSDPSPDLKLLYPGTDTYSFCSLPDFSINDNLFSFSRPNSWRLLFFYLISQIQTCRKSCWLCVQNIPSICLLTTFTIVTSCLVCITDVACSLVTASTLSMLSTAAGSLFNLRQIMLLLKTCLWFSVSPKGKAKVLTRPCISRFPSFPYTYFPALFPSDLAGCGIATNLQFMKNQNTCDAQ